MTYLLVLCIIILMFVVLGLSVVCIRDRHSKNELESEVAALAKQADHFQSHWAKTYERMQRYKAAVIALTKDLEDERNKPPIVRYVKSDD